MNKLIRWLQQILLYKPMTSDNYFKVNKKPLEELNTMMHDEFYIINLDKFILGKKDIRSYGGSIYVDRFSKHKKEIEILMSLPQARIAEKWNAINELLIKFNFQEYVKVYSEHQSISRNSIIERLKGIVDFYKNNPSDSFNMLYVKYEDTFVTLIEAIKEIKETSEITNEQTQTIFQVINTFIVEFESLKKVYQSEQEIDDVAITDSLTNRLKNELELVNKIKTDWNSNTI